MDCETCRDRRFQDVPYIVHESDMARQERTIKRLWILLVIMLLALVGSNLAWIVYENSFEDVSIEQEVDTGEGDAFVAGGNLNYGAGEADS